MASILIRVDKKLFRWLKGIVKSYHNLPENALNNKLILELGIYQLKANITKKEFMLKYDERRKCYIIKEN